MIYKLTRHGYFNRKLSRADHVLSYTSIVVGMFTVSLFYHQLSALQDVEVRAILYGYPRGSVQPPAPKTYCVVMLYSDIT